MGSFHSGRNSMVFYQKSVDQNSITRTMKRPSISSSFSRYSFLANPCKINAVYYKPRDSLSWCHPWFHDPSQGNATKSARKLAVTSVSFTHCWSCEHTDIGTQSSLSVCRRWATECSLCQMAPCRSSILSETTIFVSLLTIATDDGFFTVLSIVSDAPAAKIWTLHIYRYVMCIT